MSPFVSLDLNVGPSLFFVERYHKLNVLRIYRVNSFTLSFLLAVELLIHLSANIENQEPVLVTYMT